MTAVKNENIYYFEPARIKETPYIARVEDMLGGIGQVIHPDGQIQFAEYDCKDNLHVYSPKLPELELEQFCKEHFEQYRQHYKKHKALIDAYEQSPPITDFWSPKVEDA